MASRYECDENAPAVRWFTSIFLKGRGLYHNFAKHTHAQARAEFERALEINPVFTPALYMLGLTLTDQARFGWVKDRAVTYEAALDCATRALGADPRLR
jgi:adenylate cyclase